MKKYIIATAVVFLLIIFPLVSWYYLNSGFNYRKQALLELSPKEKIDAKLAAELELINKTTVIHRYSPDDNKLDDVKLIAGQFDHNESFQLVSILLDNELYNPVDSIQWKMVAQKDSIGYTDMLFDNNFTLIDTGLNIRNFYNAEDSSFIKLIEHIAIVLPRKKDPDIELKRKGEK